MTTPSEAAKLLRSQVKKNPGKARAQRLTPAQRSEIARKAAFKRHGKNYPKATHYGELKIGNQTIRCAVLEDGTRVVIQADLLTAIGRSPRPTGKTVERTSYLINANNLKQFIDKDFTASSVPTDFLLPNGRKAKGYRSDVLPQYCELYLAARSAGVLSKDQLRIADQCEILVRSFAKIGLVALIDEATGYQDMRKIDELQLLLNAYISEERMKWISRFPVEFFQHLYRLYGLDWKKKASKNHPRYFGQFINKFVYEKLPEGVLDELRKLNPIQDSGNRSAKHHQYLTQEVGCKHLNEQLIRVVTTMKLSRDKNHFAENYKMISGEEYQPELS